MYPEDSLTTAEGPFAGQPRSDASSPLERYGKPGAKALKRSMDIAGSVSALLLLAPLLLFIAIIVKLTSRGPVLFRQERVGAGGRRFVMLKFRTMFAGSDSAMHEAYVDRFIAGTLGPEQVGKLTVYKLTNDPRVTSFGRLLRRASLDELPQCLNVLAGSMSLVGPRPPLPYEVSRYAPWQMERLAVKPGITGLWQVSGRNRLTFDDMVHLDIKYVRSWSLWLDLRILFRTPFAVAAGQGAR
jgi:lipopolysaccharide/colanic/teichoic acid biosynthesis glycosyltransferase